MTTTHIASVDFHRNQQARPAAPQEVEVLPFRPPPAPGFITILTFRMLSCCKPSCTADYEASCPTKISFATWRPSFSNSPADPLEAFPSALDVATSQGIWGLSMAEVPMPDEEKPLSRASHPHSNLNA
jgi:hypothetical protein